MFFPIPIRDSIFSLCKPIPIRLGSVGAVSLFELSISIYARGFDRLYARRICVLSTADNGRRGKRWGFARPSRRVKELKRAL